MLVRTARPWAASPLAITRPARTHGITAERHPIDDFADAVSRLSDAEVTLDPIERLLVNLRRAGFLDGRECFALHAAYLRESETAPQVR